MCGSSGTGKTFLVNWLSKTTEPHFKCISVSCADLVHKVSLICHDVIIAVIFFQGSGRN